MTHADLFIIEVRIDDLSVQLALAFGQIKQEPDEDDTDNDHEVSPKDVGEKDTPDTPKKKRPSSASSVKPKRVLSRRESLLQYASRICIQILYVRLFKFVCSTTSYSPIIGRLKRSQELLRNAAKARIRRMVTEKKKRTDLEQPAWLRDEWNKGTREREQMAATLQDVNFCQAGWNTMGSHFHLVWCTFSKSVTFKSRNALGEV